MKELNLLESFGERIRKYILEKRQERGDVAMGCVRLETMPGFVGIVYEKPGGSSAQFETSYDPELGFHVMSPDGQLETLKDPDHVYERFVTVIDTIPEERRVAIEEQIATWRAAGYEGSRLRLMVMTFNQNYQGTTGGKLAPEELRFATQLTATQNN